MAADNNESGFLIDGKVYEVPTLDSLDMGERRVMFDLCGVVQEDFLREPDETAEELDVRVRKLMRHPGFMESLMQIAYQRGNPDAKDRKVRLVIEQTNYQEALSTLAADEPEEEDAGPLALTNEPERSSQSGSGDSASSTRDSSGNGGNGSGNGSAAPDGDPTPTTTSRSATFSTSGQGISAA